MKRVITQALAKARDKQLSARRSSSSRSKRSPDKGREDAVDRSRRRASLNENNINADGDNNGPISGADDADQGKRNNNNSHDGGDEDVEAIMLRRVSVTRSNSAVARSAAEAFLSGSLLPDPRSTRLNEDDSLSAAAAAVAAAAWVPAPRKEGRSPELSSSRRSSRRSGNGTNGSGGDREEGTAASSRANGSPAVAAAPVYPLSSREVRRRRSLDGDGDGDAPLSRGDTADAERTRRDLFSSPSEARALSPSKTEGLELDQLRRQVEELTVAVAAAESREAEGRALMRQALADIDDRAEEARRAGQAKLVKVNALVQVGVLYKVGPFLTFGGSLTMLSPRCGVQQLIRGCGWLVRVARVMRT